MNERIRELAEQAGSTHKQNLGVYQFYTDELEKFAELIVRECARVADQWVNDEDNGHNLVSDRLRQHFGVE